MYLHHWGRVQFVEQVGRFPVGKYALGLKPGSTLPPSSYFGILTLQQWTSLGTLVLHLGTALSLGLPMSAPILLLRWVCFACWTGLSLQVMLSSVQAYKGGYMAGQQHAWQVLELHLQILLDFLLWFQATLDNYRYGAVFTTQPTSVSLSKFLWLSTTVSK